MTAAVPAGAQRRVEGLDGLRGLAALYVVVHHCWLLSFRGYPANTGPVWVGWLVYGHLAVVFFLTLSGFSLALAPARAGWRLGGVTRFARRRAWRILPPYWAALAFSALVAWLVTPMPHSTPPTGRSILVYGLLLQDNLTAPVPNGAFWSIAVEAECYVALPLLLLLCRRAHPVLMFAAATLPMLLVGVLSAEVPVTDKLTGLTLQLLPLFAIGILAAGIVRAGSHTRRIPYHWLAAIAAAPVLAAIVHNGPQWTVRHYYWVDLSAAPAIALLLTAVAVGRPRPLVRLLATRPIRTLGRFSYSLYLIHVPIVLVTARKLTPHLATPGIPAFLTTAAIAVPLSLLAAHAFATVFELPFQRHRSWSALRVALRERRADQTEDPSGLLGRRVRRVARDGGTARKQEGQPVEGPQPAGGEQAVGVDGRKSGQEGRGFDGAPRQVLHEHRQLHGRGGDAGVLEVDDADAAAVPEVVGDVGVPVAEDQLGGPAGQ